MLLGGCVQGAVGFGSALVAVGLMGTLIGVKQASIAFCLPALVLSATLLGRLCDHFRWRRIGPVAVGVAGGVPLGVWFLDRADPRAVELVLAAVLVLSAAYSLIPRLSRRPWNPYLAGVPCGLLGGALGGALSTSGPPLVAYVAAQGFDRMRFAASLQVLFVVSASLRLFELIRRGLLTAPLLRLGFAGVAAMVLGSMLGLRFLRAIPERIFRLLVAAVLLALALRYLAG